MEETKTREEAIERLRIRLGGINRIQSSEAIATSFEKLSTLEGLMIDTLSSILGVKSWTEEAGVKVNVTLPDGRSIGVPEGRGLVAEKLEFVDQWAADVVDARVPIEATIRAIWNSANDTKLVSELRAELEREAADKERHAREDLEDGSAGTNIETQR